MTSPAPSPAPNAAGPEVSWDPTDPAQQHDPYPTYTRLRAEAPVWRSPLGFWVLSRYDDVAMAMADRRFVSNDRSGGRKVAQPAADVAAPTGQVAADFFANWMTFTSDEADHRRLRRLYMLGFTPQRMEGFRPRLVELVDELLDELVDETEFDFMERFAAPLPVAAICEVLGVPPSLRSVLHGLARPLARAFHAVPLDQAEMTQLDDAIASFQGAIVDFLAHVRIAPDDSMIAQLAAVEQQDASLTEPELIAGVANLFFGGHHTSVHLLGNGMLALLDHPDQAADLRSNPAIAATAAEELLRYDSPAQTGAARFAGEDIELHGTRIGDGDKVLLLIGSANRDPDVYPEPDRLDVRRENRKPLVFGRGAHLCIGAPLARMEGEVAFPALVRRLPTLVKGEGELRRSPHSLFRGLETLPVTVA